MVHELERAVHHHFRSSKNGAMRPPPEISQLVILQHGAASFGDRFLDAQRHRLPMRLALGSGRSPSIERQHLRLASSNAALVVVGNGIHGSQQTRILAFELHPALLPKG